MGENITNQSGLTRFITDSEATVQNLYKKLQTADSELASSLNSYQGTWRNKVANTWSSHYASAVAEIAELYDQLVRAEAGMKQMSNWSDNA